MDDLVIDSYREMADMFASARERTYRKANEELAMLYYEIGGRISVMSDEGTCDGGYIDGLADCLAKEYPGLKGFTRRGLYRMRRFYELYKDDEEAMSRFIQISWANNLKIMSACKTREERLFYLDLCARERYTTCELSRQIDSGYFERYMLSRHPAAPAAADKRDRTHDVFLDTYTLEFLDLPEAVPGNDLRKSMIRNLKDFVLEAGRDFTFVGEEYNLQVGGHDYFIDLLFYHRGLSCLVAFELKVGEFKPEYTGEMDLCLEALDRDVRKENENPGVGVILCAEKDDEVVEYALSRTLSPAMVSEYELKMIDKGLLQSKLREYMELAESSGELPGGDDEDDDA